ncbi:MAG: HAD family hydrolase [Thermoplasmata archaeon]
MDRAVFLDRDGVINLLRMGNYITRWEMFEFLKGAKEAIARLSKSDYLIFIITNQSAINRGLMTEAGLEVIHNNMLFEIEEAGGRIDGVYHCPHRPDEGCKCRKPETGLFDKVNEKFDIDYPKSWFIGDFESDRQVAERMGLRFILASGDGELEKAVENILEND